MSKSLRSKRKRKIRAEKRVVNAKKELVKLRQVAEKLHKMPADQLPDIQLVDASAMEVDGGERNSSNRSKIPKINSQWMNQRKIKTIKSQLKKHAKKKGRRGGPASVGSRKAKKSK